MPSSMGRPRRRAVFLAGTLLSLSAMLGLAGPAAAGTTATTEVVVYGGTPSGVIAAVTAARAGAKVILLEPTSHVGGMMSSGLGWTDLKDRASIGGYTKEFFTRVGRIEGTADGAYHFSPHAAERAFKAMLWSAAVRVLYGERLADTGPVEVVDGRITAIRTAAGNTYRAATFIDASYMGDLMAAAGVPWRVGREATTRYGEPLAGARPPAIALRNAAGLSLPGVTSAPGPVGSADDRIQDANYRVCFSSDRANQVAFRKPSGYLASKYGMVVRFIRERVAATGETPRLGWILFLNKLAEHKFDVNDNGPMSSALPGLDWTYPTASWARRAAIDAAHRRWTQGLIWFLGHDLSVPSSIRSDIARYGLCADEFRDNANWPWQLYVREGRRLQGQTTLIQSDVQTTRAKPDVIGLGSYRIDAHWVSRWVADGHLYVEGHIAAANANFAIPYGILVPPAGSVTNLLVPVAASASHVAWTALRMEPHLMVMGEAAGQAAALSLGRTGRDLLDRSCSDPAFGATVVCRIPAQRLPIRTLQLRLMAHGAILVDRTIDWSWTSPVSTRPFPIPSLRGSSAA